MIHVHRTTTSAPDVRIKVIGLGGAGGNVLDRLRLDGANDLELVAINTDVQALTASVVETKVQLGRTTTRGLGAGGDPEIGYAAAEEAVDDIRRAIDGAQLLFLCAGLGGGTGSGAARIVASLAREQHALVIAFATLPFAFEGKRRRAQADEALAALQRYSDVVIHYENDHMSDAVAPLAGIHEAFVAADLTLSQSIRALARVVRRRGLIQLGFDEIATALRGANENGARCVFGYGEADGDNRAHEALARALKNPLMHKGRMLEDARNVLVSVTGGPTMTLNEVQILMEELNRHISDQTRLLFGASVDATMGQKVGVTVLSALHVAAPAIQAEQRSPDYLRTATAVEMQPAPANPPLAPAVAARSVPSTPAKSPIPSIEPEETSVPTPFVLPAPMIETPAAVAAAEPVVVPRTPEPQPELIEAPAVAAVTDLPVEATTIIPAPATAPAPKITSESAPLFPEPAPEPARPAPAVAKSTKTKAVQPKQEQMQFEPVTRGRFEKSEPTIVDGQDLDVPTFLRRNVKVR